jgi:L-serine dehydratase
MLALVQKYGVETVDEACRLLIEQSERRLRERLTELPDGGYVLPPEQFASEMFGLGLCFQLRHSDTFALSDAVGGHARSVFLGSARAYHPGFTLESDPFQHPLVLARALAVQEVNAAMGVIVAAPTAGGAGVLPAVLTGLAAARGIDDEKLIDALATAGLIGAVVAERASLSGAEGGCQAETGAAAGMAAGAAVEMLGGTPRQVGHATALAQQGTLGLVCDPLGGLVELPCVFRNATGAAIALAAIEMAMAGIEFAIPADEVIDTMGEIGASMDVRYRETAGGGLAATPTGRRLARERLYELKRAGG